MSAQPQASAEQAHWRIFEGDCRDRLTDLDAGSVHTCITSPPYFGLRDYGHTGQLGLEATPDEYVTALVGVFREVRRVLRDDGTVWLNLGDSYATGAGKVGDRPGGGAQGDRWRDIAPMTPANRMPLPGCKPKDLIGVPWMVAFALRADGWYLRSDIIWSKPNPMPESVTDRPTKSHEYVFLLSKGPRYFYDADAIREAHEMRPQRRPGGRPEDATPRPGQPKQAWSTAVREDLGVDGHPVGRNKRSVWTVATQPYPGAHFATFPPKLIEPCILAGCPEGGIVLDPFAGTGTTGVVALRHGRSFVGIESNPAYVQLGRDRIVDDAPLLNSVAERCGEER